MRRTVPAGGRALIPGQWEQKGRSIVLCGAQQSRAAALLTLCLLCTSGWPLATQRWSCETSPALRQYRIAKAGWKLGTCAGQASAPSWASAAPSLPQERHRVGISEESNTVVYPALVAWYHFSTLFFENNLEILFYMFHMIFGVVFSLFFFFFFLPLPGTILNCTRKKNAKMQC